MIPVKTRGETDSTVSDTEGGRVIACRDHYYPLRVIFANSQKKIEEIKRERKKRDMERKDQNARKFRSRREVG